MSIRVNLPGIESQSSSVRTMCQAYIDAMRDVKTELQTFIMDVSLQGKTYKSAKAYFSEIYIPLADGIILLCERVMQVHEQFPQQYKENVDTNSLASDDLAKQIKSLDMLIQAFEAQAATTMIAQSLFHQRIMMYKHMREKVSATLDRLVEFDTSSANIFSDIQELLANVETGLDQIQNRKAWNPTTETFYIKDWDLSWASSIKDKKKIEAMEGDDVSLQNGDANDEEEAQLKVFLSRGEFDDAYHLDQYEFPEDEPIGFWDKRKVVGGNSPLSGTPDGLAGYAKYAFDVQKGMHDGVRGVLFDTAGGLFGFASDPFGTSYSILNSLVHPINTYNIMKDAINTSYERDVINGDAESRAEWFSYAGGTIITSALGTKGAGTVTKAGTSTAKTGVANAKTKLGNMEFRSPLGRDPEFALAGGNIPYNVYDGDALKSQHLQFAENFKDGKSGVNPLLSKGMVNKIDTDTIKKYIRDIEGRTGRELPKNQVEKLKEALRNKEYKKMSPIETAKHRAEFDKVKNKVIKEWEENTGQKWPVYNENIISEKTGKIIRKQGDKYDAHHIIENRFEGEHEWWNLHPAKFPNEHQAGIHGTGSPANTLFKGDTK